MIRCSWTGIPLVTSITSTDRTLWWWSTAILLKKKNISTKREKVIRELLILYLWLKIDSLKFYHFSYHNFASHLLQMLVFSPYTKSLCHAFFHGASFGYWFLSTEGRHSWIPTSSAFSVWIIETNFLMCTNFFQTLELWANLFKEF